MIPLRDRALAVTSHLWECSLAENLNRISRWDLPIRQVGLLFYECAPSLGYAPEEFFALTGLCAHAHLPMDLPWEEGAQAVWDIICRLMEKPVQCRLWGGVLHPPEDVSLLADVGALWRRTEPGWRLMVENVPSQDLRAHWPVIREMDLPVCLDVGHLMAFGQEWMLEEPELPGRVELVHFYAPGRAPGVHVHLPLSELTAPQAIRVRRILDMAPAAAPILFEVFSYAHLVDSLERFYQLDMEGENRQ